MLQRELYLSKIRKFYHMNLVKIITGIKRCGKSVLLSQIREELQQEGIPAENIIYINFEDYEYSAIGTIADLMEYVQKSIVKKEKYYVFLDEVHLLTGFEGAIKAFLRLYDCSLFLTSSNGCLLTQGFLQMTGGKYVSFQIYPFSLREVCELRNSKRSQVDESYLLEYMILGGLPIRFAMEDVTQSKTILRDVYCAIILKDMIERGGIKDIELFNLIIQYHIEHIAEVFSLTALIEYISGTGRKVSKATIYSYIELMNSSYLTMRAQRYDIRENRVLTKMDKYYLAGAGMGTIYTPEQMVSNKAMLENTVYIELLRRGYKVYVGKNRSAEIDFVAVKGLQKEYYQIMDRGLSLKEKENECQILMDIPDHYPKYVISFASDLEQRLDTIEGITFIDAIKFLMMEQ